MILGIDEAGRGAVIGPLVIAGVWWSTQNVARLRALGVQDSKAFTGGSVEASEARRDACHAIMMEAPDTVIRVASADEVDRAVNNGGLNNLERRLVRQIISAGPEAKIIIADGRALFDPLKAEYPQLQVHDKADATYPIVSAASIVAKTERDQLFKNICIELGIDKARGAGYPNNETLSWLKDYVTKHMKMPDELRLSYNWKPMHQLRQGLGRVLRG